MDTPESVPEPETTEQKGLVVPNAYDTARAMVQHVDAQALLAMAIERNVPIETMERLLALRERLKAEQAKELFFAALSDFQAECPIITKNKVATIQSDRGGYKYAYATLDEIVRQVSPILAKYGLSVTTQTRLEPDPLTQVAICTVHHTAGYSQASEFRAPIDKSARMNDMQKGASAATYARRYAYCNALGILTGDADDDANATGIKEAVAEVFRSPRATTGGHVVPKTGQPGSAAILDPARKDPVSEARGGGSSRPTRSGPAAPANMTPESTTGKGRDIRPGQPERRVAPPAQGPPTFHGAVSTIPERLMDAAQHRGLEKQIVELAEAQGKSPALLRQELHTWAEKTLKKASFKLFTVEDLMRISSHINKLWNDVPPR